MRSGEEIQATLRAFVARWEGYTGGERSEAQTFLNELFACFGADRKEAGARFEDSRSSLGIMDLHLPGVVIVEMKAPGEAGRLEVHRRQALRYWRESADAAADRPAPPYVVLCAFQQFEVWEPGKYPTMPRASFPLAQLPEYYETLLFLTGSEEPLFAVQHRELTEEATKLMAKLYHTLLDRKAAEKETIQAFVLQAVWVMFAEGCGMLSGRPLERMINTLITASEFWTTSIVLGGLFESLNDDTEYRRHGVLAGTHYVNGELFARPARVDLTVEELKLLREAANYEWDKVDPTIFGSLMEGCLGREQRWELGAHYTHEADIMKIVRPTVVEPWRERIAATTTPDEARALLDDMCAFRVLDPACGCGNFLYLAYRELRHLEHDLKARIGELAGSTGLPAPPGPLPHYPLENLYGIDIELVVTQIARLTLWMGHRQMMERFGSVEPALPLTSLYRVHEGDALRIDWPEADCVIGNPPFLGSQHLRRARGYGYLDWLKQEFKVGIKDYCVYWFRRAHDHLEPGQRAGLVGTNSIAQNRARSASLEYVTGNGGVITDAVSTQKWPGEAKVHVSLVNWIKSPAVPPTGFSIDGEQVSGITAELRAADRSTADAKPLDANKAHCFQGPIPVGEGFVISGDEAKDLLARSDASYRDVVRPYLTGDDIADDPRQQPRRWIIDFVQMPLEEAMRYPAALKIVRERVKPFRDTNPRKARRERWWQFGEKAVGMRVAIAYLPCYLTNNRVGKRLLFCWTDPWTCPSDLTVVVALRDDYAMGVLSASAHGTWAWARSSTLKGDIRYTPTTVFETFPWPYPVTDEQRERVAEASRKVIARRQEICAREDFGLTRLYNLVDEGAYADLKALHQELDEAVAAAYGWPRSIAQDGDEMVRRLLALNREIAAGERPYDPFGTQSTQRPSDQTAIDITP